MATLEPLSIAEAAARTSMSEEFLTGLVAKAVKVGVIEPQIDGTIRSSDLSRLGKVYYHQIESEQHRQAYLRVRARDDAELQERLERGKAS